MKNLKELLSLFTADNVPEIGPEEDIDIGEPFWKISDQPTDPSWPGEGLARYPMLYIGEGCNKMFLINEGKIIWTYSTGKGWEYDDLWMTKNGNILFTRMPWAGEVTPTKKLVWKYDCGENREVHAIQPIDDDKALMVVNGYPAKLVMINRKNGDVMWEKEVPVDWNLSVHGQFRRLRYTAQGTYLLSYLQEAKVVEYDQDLNVIWQYDVDMPWSAIRLKNGNTLITAEREERLIEVTPEKEIVWEFHLNEVPEPYRLHGSQSACRLSNGNTILCSRGDDGKGPQLIEITKDKEVVWVLNDWRELGPCTSVQILSEPGFSEIPGDLER